jgi:hypothetical protein
MPEPGSLPFPAESIQQMLRDIVELSGVLGFLLQLGYGDPLSITVNGVTTKVLYDENNPEEYDRIYISIADGNTQNMQNLSTDIYELAFSKKGGGGVIHVPKY